jgi:hypothetical protein
MPTDDDLVARIGALLREEAATLRPAPGLMASLRRRHTRQTWGVRAAVAAPVAAVILATTLVALHGTGGRANSIPESSRSTAILDVAHVTAQTEAVLAGAARYVVRSRTVTADGVGYTEAWLDPADGRNRADTYDGAGRRTYTEVFRGGENITVDYTHRTWWTERSGPRQNSAYLSPETIRFWVGNGTLRAAGLDRVNGHDAVHFQTTDMTFAAPATSTSPSPSRGPLLGGPSSSRVPLFDLWVDGATYLPFRLNQNFAKGQANVTDYSWLPRSPANLAPLAFTPPTGYTKIPDPGI